MKNFMENLYLTKKQWYYLGAVLGVCLIYFAFTHFKDSEAPQKNNSLCAHGYGRNTNRQQL